MYDNIILTVNNPPECVNPINIMNQIIEAALCQLLLAMFQLYKSCDQRFRYAHT